MIFEGTFSDLTSYLIDIYSKPVGDYPIGINIVYKELTLIAYRFHWKRKCCTGHIKILGRELYEICPIGKIPEREIS